MSVSACTKVLFYEQALELCIAEAPLADCPVNGFDFQIICLQANIFEPGQESSTVSPLQATAYFHALMLLL